MQSRGIESERLLFSAKNKWKIWGPYLAERQWGTVREDYSEDGSAWEYISHEKARSNTYRWGEEGIAGFCDHQQTLCIAPAFWNGKDPILKERLFGLTNSQGNHGEDVKELYYHLDSSPTHSYCKYLYRYPQAPFPYKELVIKNQTSRLQPEYELLDTGLFADKRYFDCFVEYAKADVNDVLLKITIYNRSSDAELIHVIPNLWFRNYWTHNSLFSKPRLRSITPDCIEANSAKIGIYYLHHDPGEQMFCDNETNNEKVYNGTNKFPFVKDGINDYIIDGKETINPKKTGTKAGVWFKREVPAGGSVTFRVRLTTNREDPWHNFENIFAERKKESDDFYNEIIPETLPDDEKYLIRSSFAGLLWTKQFYYLDVYKWLNGEPGSYPPNRKFNRNKEWQHLTNRNIISMPDKWEYPWYAAWDLAFHASSFVYIDPDFAKNQLLLMLREYYMHPNGQIPAYEWNFSDVNPPVHGWAVWQVYEKDKLKTGVPDLDFLEKAFQKLLINFTWWVNQKDVNGIDLFEGGFLGLDNIGVFDRNSMPPGIKNMQQCDATSWMAMFSLNMLRMSLELSIYNPAHEELAAKFFRHFLNIAWALHHIGKKDISLWDEKDDFYYDAVQFENGKSQLLKIRSLVGIIPMLAVEVIDGNLFKMLDEFKNRAEVIIRTRPDLAQLISRIEKLNEDGNQLFSIIRGYRLQHLLVRILDENEFLSEFGIRSLSKYHLENPFVFDNNGLKHTIQYDPGESTTYMFGGNSNWRGPIWFPLNYLIIQSLRKYYKYYGPGYIYEFPTRSGNMLNLNEIAFELTKRLKRLFERDEKGKYNYNADNIEFYKDENFAKHHLFFEFFHGDSGKGLGASHQTGWTALISNLLLEFNEDKSNSKTG